MKFDFLLFFGVLLAECWQILCKNGENEEFLCENLRRGQYFCDKLDISPLTQQPKSCRKDGSVIYTCHTIPKLQCENYNGSFEKIVPNRCKLSGSKDFRIALILSIFFGFLGFDRFYLGYYAIGFFKLCTFGFFFLFHLLDVILIALQLVGPADGTEYRMDYFGPKMERLLFGNETLLKTNLQ